MTMLIAGVGGSPAVGPTSGGKIYAYNNIGTSTSIVAQAVPQRTSITFYNPGPVNIIVGPQYVQAINNGSIALTNQPNPMTIAEPGGGFIVFANGGSLRFDGECQGAWLAMAVTGSTNALTVSDTNV